MKFPRLSHILALVIILAASLFAFAQASALYGSSAIGALVALVVVCALSGARPTQRLGAFTNTVDAELTLAKQLDIILEEFVAEILPLRAFSMGVTNGQTLNSLGTRDVLVPYVPAMTAASRNFDASAGDCYVVDPTDTQKRKVTVNRRKYQSLGITSEQAAINPILRVTNPVHLKQKGRKLAADMIADILSVVSAANFPNESVVGAAGAFDTDVMFDVREDANGFKMPKMGRSAILNDAYYTALLKDNKDANVYGGTRPRWDAEVPRIAGFDTYDTTEGLDATADVDAGIVVFPSAILVAQAPLEPTDAVKQKLVDFQVITHEESGISLVYKRMADEWCDKEGEIVEVSYGFAEGEEDALLRLVES